MQLSPVYMPEGDTRTLRDITIVCHLIPRLKPELRITKTHNVQIVQHIRPVHRQRNIIHKRTIGTSPVTQYILPIATADLSMHARNRTMLDQKRHPALPPDRKNLALAARPNPRLSSINPDPAMRNR